MGSCLPPEFVVASSRHSSVSETLRAKDKVVYLFLLNGRSNPLVISHELGFIHACHRPIQLLRLFTVKMPEGRLSLIFVNVAAQCIIFLHWQGGGFVLRGKVIIHTYNEPEQMRKPTKMFQKVIQCNRSSYSRAVSGDWPHQTEIGQRQINQLQWL